MEYQFTEPSKKIAAFDLDHTLVKPKNGRQIPTSVDDWEYTYPNVLSDLELLRVQGWKIVIFTNQKKKKNSITFEDLLKKLSVILPFTADVFMSYSEDYFRKPMKGMWDEFISLNGCTELTFYVGDAAGRPSDHSDADRRFAHNIGIPYYLPEEIFDNINFNAESFVPEMHTHDSLRHIPIVPKFPIPIGSIQKITAFLADEKAVVIMTGRPASGKSYLSQRIADVFPDAIIISNDTTGSSKKSEKLFKESLDNDTNLIILDNTFPDALKRGEYIYVIPSDYTIISINCILPENLCIILDERRAYENKTTTIPSIVYRIFKSKYEPPSKKEGFHKLFNYLPNIQL